MYVSIVTVNNSVKGARIRIIYLRASVSLLITRRASKRQQYFKKPKRCYKRFKECRGFLQL
jgi:hypothetical protein